MMMHWFLFYSNSSFKNTVRVSSTEKTLYFEEIANRLIHEGFISEKGDFKEACDIERWYCS